MSMLSDREIIQRCQPRNYLAEAAHIDYQPMIDPFVNHQVKEVRTIKGETHKVISYGVSSYGYDARLGWDFKVFTNIRSRIIDPKNFDEGCFEHVVAEVGKHEWVQIPPNSFALGVSIERFCIPRDILTLCLGKSTYARCGILVNITPLEPEWRGHITIEISNTTPLPAVVYPGEGICQLVFLKADPLNICHTSYGDKAGKYQDQQGITLPKV